MMRVSVRALSQTTAGSSGLFTISVTDGTNVEVFDRVPALTVAGSASRLSSCSLRVPVLSASGAMLRRSQLLLLLCFVWPSGSRLPALAIRMLLSFSPRHRCFRCAALSLTMSNAYIGQDVGSIVVSFVPIYTVPVSLLPCCSCGKPELCCKARVILPLRSSGLAALHPSIILACSACPWLTSGFVLSMQIGGTITVKFPAEFFVNAPTVSVRLCFSAELRCRPCRCLVPAWRLLACSMCTLAAHWRLPRSALFHSSHFAHRSFVVCLLRSWCPR